MALNIKPYFGLHYPSSHPEVTYPPDENVLTPSKQYEHPYGENLKRRQKLLNRIKKIQESEGDYDLLKLLDTW